MTATSGRPASIEARLLTQGASGLDHAGLLRHAAARLDTASAERLAAFARRRLNGEPISRVLGSRDFFGLTLQVRPDVLDPREDTETLVRLACELRTDGTSTARILDLGTGSGALLCALLTAFPTAWGLGVDRSPTACSLARENLRVCGLATRGQIVCGDWSAALVGPFDVIVSNPPYIARGDIATLPREVRDHDPVLALDGGLDGLDAYRAFLADVRRIGRSRALLVLEIGAGQQAQVEALLTGEGLSLAGVKKDGGEHVRAVAAELS